jgi:DNA-binding CsgD family transcriptional regulator
MEKRSGSLQLALQWEQYVNLIQRIPLLTSRELQILELVALGNSAKEVALECDIAPRTVECHLDTMRLKLQARNRTHMVAIAIASNVLSRCKFLSEPRTRYLGSAAGVAA